MFRIVRIIMLKSDAFSHSGCAKLITSYPLDFVTSNKVPLDIGTRFPIFIKEDENILSTKKISYSELQVEQSFENYMDTLDGILPQNEVIFSQEYLPQGPDVLQDTLNSHDETCLEISKDLFTIDIESNFDFGNLSCDEIEGIDIEATCSKRLEIEAGSIHNIETSIQITNELNFHEKVDTPTTISITPYNGLKNLSYEENRIGLLFRDGTHRHHINFENLQGFYQDYTLYGTLLVDFINDCQLQEVMTTECSSIVRKIKSRAHHWQSLFTIG